MFDVWIDIWRIDMRIDMDSNMMCYMGLAYENGLIYMHQYGTIDVIWAYWIDIWLDSPCWEKDWYGLIRYEKGGHISVI